MKGWSQMKDTGGLSVSAQPSNIMSTVTAATLVPDKQNIKQEERGVTMKFWKKKKEKVKERLLRVFKRATEDGQFIDLFHLRQ